MRAFSNTLFFVFLAFLCRPNAIAQIYTPGGTVSSVTNGTNNVGIGTVTPAHALSIYREAGADLSIVTNQSTTESSLWFRINAVGKDAGIVYRSDGRLSFNLDNSNGGYVETNEFLSILPSGNVGIGMTTPASKLDVNGGITVQSNNNVQWGGAYGPGIPTISGAVNYGLYFYPTGSTSGISMHIHPSGNVGIGTTEPDAKLAVNGDIHTREVKVDLNGAVAPDYVFEKDYPLLPLDRLESYLAQHKHLPEIPSGREMEQEGLNLKEMNLLLLKKVEELTMYVIEQSKIINKQEDRIESLENEIKQ